MRQGGMVPKGHNSGTYWIRANANTGNKEEYNDEKASGKYFALCVIVTLFLVCALVA